MNKEKVCTMNATHITGYLTADIETIPLNDKSLSKFTIASSQGDRTVFLPVEVWNQDHLPKYLRKGSKVLVSGSLKQESWLNKEGERRSRIVLVGQYVEFLDPKPQDAGERPRAVEEPRVTAAA